MQITGGRVVYSRTVQPAQYESKRGEVELTFVLAEGEDLGAALDEVADLVKAKALDMVGLKSPRK
jgi:hypothetical protein